MKTKMIWIAVALAIGLAILLPILMATQNAIVEVFTITVGVTLYHFAMRLAVGWIVNLVMQNRADYGNAWFREKRFENKLFKLVGLRKWRKYLPTYSPDTFDARQRTVQELVGATCQAEVVHEIIMAFSLLPILLIPLLGGAAALIATSVLSMLIDFAFVLLQRYNRPRLVRAMKRFDKLQSGKEGALR